MEYLNLRISNPQGLDQGSISILARSRLGETRARVSHLPFYQDATRWRTTLIKALGAITYRLEDFPHAEEQQWLHSVGLLDTTGQHFSDLMLTVIGKAIYAALFPGDVHDLLQRTLGAVGAGESLHIQIEFSQEIAPDSRIADYPWELACNELGFLCRQNVTFSRYIAFLDAPPNLPPVETIRVLLVSSAGYDPEMKLASLDDQEQRAVVTGLESAQAQGRVALNQLKLEQGSATFKALGDYLLDHIGELAPHVIHFDGHGFFGKRCGVCRTIHRRLSQTHCRKCQVPLPDSPQGYLVFESGSDASSPADYVSAAEFGQLLRDVGLDQPQAQGIRLVVTSACQSGRALGSESVFNGVAQGLIQHGIPAVVAMQHNVTVNAAAAFAERFYRAIASHRPLAAALKIGQGAMTEPNQWYRPILYLRWLSNEGGQLFDLTENSLLSGIPAPLPAPKPEVKTPQASGTRGKIQQLLHTKLVVGAGTGIGVTLIVLIARIFSILQPYELGIYDRLLTLRPAESVDSRITVIEATEADLSEQRQAGENFVGGSNISVDALMDVFQRFQQEDHQPAAIALDLYRDFQEAPQLAELFRNTPNLVGVCELPSDDNENGVLSPDPIIIPRERVGFSNFVFDKELFEKRGKVRRQLISLPIEPAEACKSPFSFSFLAANHYLEQNVGERWTPDDDGNLVLGDKTLPRMATFSFGGYQYVDTRGIQVMLNYRAPRVDDPEEEKQPLRAIAPHISIQAVRAGTVSSEAFKDKVVLIGITAATEASDVYYTPYGTTVGVTIQAHMISYLLSAAMDDDHSQIWALPQGVEALWILGWGLLGGIAGVYLKHRWVWFIVTGGGVALIVGVGTAAMIISNGWIPVLPALLTLIGAGTFINYRYYGITPLH